jgi:hypothetical protein
MAGWLAPRDSARWSEGKCGVPARNGHDTDHRPCWQCKPDTDCKREGCGCYVCVIAPGSRQLRVDAKPGENESGWSVREDLKWIAPEGYKLAETCPQSCLTPQWESSSAAWICDHRAAKSGEHECFLLGVAPGGKQLHFLARPESRFAAVDVPPVGPSSASA